MSKSIPKYLIAEEAIKLAIKRGEITGKLPGERELAKEFGISYMTLRKAVDNLVDTGILYRIPMKGTFLADKKIAGRRTHNIGYFLDSSIKGGLTSPYYSLIFNSLEKYAKKNGYALMYFSDLTESNIEHIASKVDGLIISCFPRIEELIHELNQKIPVVVIDNNSIDETIPSVTIDNFRAVIDSVEHLIRLGHKRIGFMTGLEDSDVGTGRLMGYVQALTNNAMQLQDELVFKGNYTFESGMAGAEYFLSLQKPPTAIVCANDSMAIGAMKRITQDELSVPDDISVIGFDDITIASQITPPLTTVSAPVNKIAELAFQQLFALLRGEQPDALHVGLPARLVVRATCTNPGHSRFAA
jgi:DNA-binding LacI/PurR family transcriptional regulator